MDIKIRKGVRIISLQAAEKRALAAPIAVLDDLIELAEGELVEEAMGAKVTLSKLTCRFPAKIKDGQKELPFDAPGGSSDYQPDEVPFGSDEGTRNVPCKSCGQPIIFLATTRGNTMPVNAETVKPGETRYDMNKGHVSHFATCPKAAEHRKEKA